MLNKTKKVAFLTSGLAGALVVSSAAGVALSSCTTTNTSNNTDSSDKYTYAIDWTDQDQVKQLTIDEQGLVYSSASKTEIIAVAPNTAATSVVIPASVKYITGYNEITKNSDGTIATSTTKGAFQGLVSLISVTFASDTTLVSIGDSAFSGCTYLSTISLPSSTSVVYNNAFLNCTNLRSINLVGVSYIGSSAFQNAMANGAGVSIDLSSASYIGDNAFNGCTSLVKADFSSNTTLSYIGVSAFNGAFVNGDSATTLDLSKATTLKTISDSAFAGCTNLTSVVLPSSSALTTIGAKAFSGASNLTQVGSATGTFTAPSSLGNYVLTTVSSTSTSYVSSGIGANAFSGTKIATIDLSAVTATTPLGDAAFKGMAALTSVNFGSSKITTIPYSLFENDTALTTLTLPSSITTIQNGANNSNNGTEYTNKKSPFYGSGLKTVDMSAITSYYTGSTELFGVTIDNTTMVPEYLFQGLTSLTNVVLKKGTVVIGSNAFNGASALTSVKEGSTSTAADTTDGLVIPTTLEMINASAFEGTGIKSVSFASTTSSSNSLWFIGQDVFKSTTALATVDLSYANTTTEHTIQTIAMSSSGTTNTVSIEGLGYISTGTFSNSSALTTVTLPTSITNISTGAFVSNTALKTVNFDKLTKLASIETSNFTGASALSTIDLSATAMNATAFATASIFTGLPSAATLKLPSIATSLDSTSFLVGEAASVIIAANRPNITYSGNTGLNLLLGSTTETISSVTSQVVGTIGNGSSSGTAAYPNTMLQFISGDYDLTKSVNTSTTSNNVSTGADIGLYYPWTFYGNTKLTSLTMSASKFVLQGASSSAPTQAIKLFMINPSGSSQPTFAYKVVPFGGNTALTDFKFTGFDVNSSSTEVDVTNIDNPLYKTTVKTWAQVSTIINKFAANSLTSIKEWPSNISSGTPADENKIQCDSVFSGTKATGNTEGYTVGATDSYSTSATTGNSQNLTFTFAKKLSSSDNKSWSFVHNGVTWTLTVVPATSSSSGSVTLVGKGINVYKGSNGSATSAGKVNSQIPFATTTTNGATTANKITVTLNII